MIKLRCCLLFTLFCSVLVASAFGGEARFWTGGGGDKNWFKAENWSPDTAFPQAGDTVTISGGASVILSNQTALLDSITITNATLTFTNWQTRLLAVDVDIQKSGKLGLPPAFKYESSAMSNRVHIVCSNLTVATGGSINTDASGYAIAEGPGKGQQSGSNNNSGGGHGGRGGDESGGVGGVTYDSVHAPSIPGSGGGQYLAEAGGNGGGVVRIEATRVTVNGIISANGETGGPYNGGGAGGAIHITCITFGGTNGMVSANGGNGGRNYGGGGGGGGRIAVDYTNLSGSPAVLFTTAAGLLYTRLAAGMGTLWLPDMALVTPDKFSQRFNHVRLIVPGFTSWSLDSLTLSNTVVGLGETDSFKLTVTNNLTIGSGAWLTLGGVPQSAYQALSASAPATNPVIDVGGTMKIDGGALVLGGQDNTSKPLLNVGADLVITNAGRLDVYSAPTSVATANGASVMVVGDLMIAADSWLYPRAHPTNGGSPRFYVSDVVIAAGGGINADGRGYRSEGTAVYGPGKGISAGSRGGGGGYGGRGGRGENGSATGGSPYGSTNAPLAPGSGGGYGHAPQPGNAWGGGSVQIDAANVTLDGTISAAGDPCASPYGGGGSGGGVLIVCDTFRGAASGLVAVKGGNGGLYGGGGGGGRAVVAVGLTAENRTKLWTGQIVDNLTTYTVHSGYDGTVSALNGHGNYSPYAEPGTWRFITVFEERTFPVTIQGNPGKHDSPHPDGYGIKVGVRGGTWITNSVTSPSDTANGQRWVCLGWELTNGVGRVDTGSGTQATFAVTTNLFLTWQWTNQYELTVQSGVNGSVNAGVVDGWYTNAVSVAGIAATAAVGYEFYEWTGDVPNGQKTANPLTITMDQPRTIRANFASIAGQTKTWSGTDNWENEAKWSPVGIPGPRDDVILQSGSVLLARPHNIMSLVVSNTATLVFTNWTTTLSVSNIVILRSGATVTMPKPFVYGTQMSNRIHFVCSDFLMESGSLIDASAKGYLTHTGPGKGTGSGSNHGAGGGYGGRGGDSDSGIGGATYGATNAPIDPGSGGGGTWDNLAGHGGGAVHLEASGQVRVNGAITANGGNGGTYNGGGAGGSIFISCNTFEGSGTGALSAKGGDKGAVYTSLGGGGGGRIAVWYSVPAEYAAGIAAGSNMKKAAVSDSHPDFLGATTRDGGTGYNDGEPGTIVFITVPPPVGTIIVLR